MLAEALLTDSFAPQLVRLCLAGCHISDSSGSSLAQSLGRCKVSVVVVVAAAAAAAVASLQWLVQARLALHPFKVFSQFRR